MSPACQACDRHTSVVQTLPPTGTKMKETFKKKQNKKQTIAFPGQP